MLLVLWDTWILLEVEFRYRDPQLKGGGNLSYEYLTWDQHLQILTNKHSFYCKQLWFDRRINQINHYAAELLRTIFHLFEAGIANAISSSKWRKMIIFMKKKRH